MHPAVSIGRNGLGTGTVVTVPGSVASSSLVRNLKDLRAAIRHGEAVTIRRVDAAVISRLATAVAAMQSSRAPSRPTNRSANWQRVQQRADLARDAVRLSAAVVGIALAVWLTDEILTTLAITMLALLPAVVFLTKSAESSAVLHALRDDATHVTQLHHNVVARRRWLTTVQRSSKLLTRALANPHALYETPHFGTSIRLMRRQPMHSADVARLESALQRARNVELIINNARSRTGVDLDHVIQRGWSSNVRLWRNVAAVMALGGLITAAVMCSQSRPLASIIAGLACSAALGIRYFISLWETRRIDFTIRRQSTRLRYTDFTVEVDGIIQAEIDRLVGVYANGLDVEIDPFEDLEPQLRRQVDTAIAYSTEKEQQLHDVLDLRSITRRAEK